jgi:hypothetical protein
MAREGEAGIDVMAHAGASASTGLSNYAATPIRA